MVAVWGWTRRAWARDWEDARMGSGEFVDAGALLAKMSGPVLTDGWLAL